ncbi:10794_t:CDS:1, partial [Cetraspora pellucida]
GCTSRGRGTSNGPESSNGVVSSNKIKLYRADNSNPPNFTSLEPSQNGEDPSIAKLGLVDEQILYLVYWDDKN